MSIATELNIRYSIEFLLKSSMALLMTLSTSTDTKKLDFKSLHFH